MSFEPKRVDKRLRQTYPAYRWLTMQSRSRGSPWRENTLENTMVKVWGKQLNWSLVVDTEGATLYGPDGDAVYWEDPGK